MKILLSCADSTKRAVILKSSGKSLRPKCAGKSFQASRTAALISALSGVFDFFTRLFGEFEDWHTEPSEFFETADRVIAVGTYSGRAKATGKSFESRFAHIWTVRDGVIVRLQQCADTVQLAKALRQDFSGEQKPK